MELQLERDNEPSKIQCTPLCTVDELMNWRSITCSTRFQPASLTCLAADDSTGQFVRKNVNQTTKTILCHDMKGGYLEDSFIDGCSNPKAFNFTQWNLVDIFVYFSHHFITIPPPCWIHSAHIHGVPILGTLITEWDSGAEICQTIFNSRSSVDELVDKLAQITVHYNFDGWLINIENPMQEDKIENVVYFLKRLRNELHHRGISSAQVIWYDSITSKGELKWQNKLNENNRIFFDACDGIFLNYTWTGECLAQSVINANQRVMDVYVGVDVFGRNCFGGGGFNTNAALSLIRQNGLSAAIFAPGWVYECHDIDTFPALNAKFWLLLMPYLSVKGPRRLPLETSFCPGYGLAKYRCGKLIEAQPWFNMLLQQVQPCVASVDGLTDPSSSETLPIQWDAFRALKFGQMDSTFGRQSICAEDAYNGGACLFIESRTLQAVYPLFVCDITTSGPLLIAAAFRDFDSDVTPTVIISTVDASDDSSPDHQTQSYLSTDEALLIPDSSYMNYRHLFGRRFKPAEPGSPWKTKLFRLDLENPVKICGICLITKGFTMGKLGYFGVFQL